MNKLLHPSLLSVCKARFSNMKNFAIRLDNPQQEVYFPGMTISGVVIAENVSEPKAYKMIQVALTGEACVSFYLDRVFHHGNESFIQCQSVLWDKDRDAAGGMYPVGTYHYQFSLPLIARKLPPSHGDGNAGSGHIAYMIIATIHKEGVLRMNCVVSIPITVANAVAISDPLLQQPRSKEVRKTLCCLCCASGPIVITATVPRTGYCVGCDSIPLEVTIENGSSRNVRKLVAAIVKDVTYRSNGGQTATRSKTIASIATCESIGQHSTVVWRPEAFEVPYTETTSEKCAILKVTYYLKVSGVIAFDFDATVQIPLVLGNIPFTSPDAQATSAGSMPEISSPPTQGPLLESEVRSFVWQDASSVIRRHKQELTPDDAHQPLLWGNVN